MAQLTFDSLDVKAVSGSPNTPRTPAFNTGTPRSEMDAPTKAPQAKASVAETDAVEVLDVRLVKYCRTCFRDDFHSNVTLPPFLFGFLLVATFGLVLLVKPSRCVCCGTPRLF